MENIIKNNKPNISASTIKTYISLLRSLYYKKHKRGSEINLDWFNDQDEVIELLNDKAPSSRKTTYAALIALTEKNDKYKKALLEDGKEYDTWLKTQEKTPTQERNWKEFDQIKTVYENMFTKVKPLLATKEPLDRHDYKRLQEFIVLSLTSGYWIPPRRSMDWTDFKIKNIDKANDNFLDKTKFVFNKYKTAKYYSQQTVDVPKGLLTILKKWIKINPNEYLIASDSGSKLSNVRLTQMLNKIFGNQISTSMLRHIYLTDRLKDIPKIDELTKLQADMGQGTLGQQLEYVKR